MLRSKLFLLLAVLTLFFAACGDDDDDGGGSADVGDYASDICTAFTDWTQAIQDRQTELQEGLQPGASPQEGKDALQGFLDDAVAASDQLVEDVDAAGTPDTENGEDAAEALQGAAEGARDQLAEAQEGVADLPIDSPQAFGEAADQFGNDVRSALEGVGEGLQDIDTPELDEAIDEEEACQGGGA
ncbi:MAG: hypothetical protein ACRDJY_12105 [Thermoleophilaceae bacterium]